MLDSVDVSGVISVEKVVAGVGVGVEVSVKRADVTLY